MSELVRVLDKHRAQLSGTPGYTGSAIGFKVRAGEILDQPAIVVFVDRKRQDLAADQRIPASLDGVPTDVVERQFGFVRTATDPFARFAQVFSGISITPHAVPEAWGTFGCVIHTTGNPAHQVPAGTYLLTNQHVLAYADPHNPNSPSRLVIQPGHTADPVPLPYRCGDYVSGQITPTSDCAIASIGYGRTWRNEVPNHPWRPGRRDFSVVGVAALGDEVYKYGATSGSTRGVVRFIHFSPVHVAIQDAIYVESLDGSTWVGKGDSGSILIRYSDDVVLGLNFAADDATMLNPNQHPPLPGDVPAFSAGYAYDIQSQMNVFGGVVTLAPNP